MHTKVQTIVLPKKAHNHYYDQLIQVICREVHISREDLLEVSDFAMLGIDRMLSMTIMNSFIKSSGLKLTEEFLQLHPNTDAVEHYFAKNIRHTAKPTQRNMKSLGTDSSVPRTLQSATPTISTKAQSSPRRSQVAASTMPLAMRLQGDPKCGTRNLFLLPDGSGSAYSYIHLPTISPGVCIYALNSPFLVTPRDEWSIEDSIPIWIAEIKAIQPCGPYSVGGWSAGGYYAFELAKQLMKDKEVVDKIILIDSPCRLDFEALPMEVVQYLFDHNMLGNIKSKQAPRWLLDHFHATIKAVEGYHPTKISAPHSPEVYIIWAAETVFSTSAEAYATGLNLDTKVARFMVEDRSDFGPHSWNKLFPGSKVMVTKTTGSHFNLAFPPNAEYLGGLIHDALLTPVDRLRSRWQRYQ